MNSRNKFLSVLFLIVILGSGLRIYNLGEKSFDRDEFFELNSSYGYYKTGSWVAWDFGNNEPFGANQQDKTSTERAEIYRWQLAQLYKYFEPSEEVVRLVSVFWGVISIVLIYFIALSFTGNPWIALLAAFLVAVGESGIIYSRRLRMYSMFFPCYLIFSWLVFKFYETRYEGKKNKVFASIYEKMKVNFHYFLPMAVAGLISYNVQMLTASIAATLAAFSFYGWIIWEKGKKGWNKYSITLVIFLAGYLVVSMSPPLAKFYKTIKKQLDLFRFNSDYFNDYFNDFSIPAIGFILAIIGAYLIYKKLERRKAVFIIFSAFIPLLFAIFTWVRFPAQRYIYFAQSFGIILISAGVYAIASYLYMQFKKGKKLVVVIFLIIFISMFDWSYFKKENQIYTHTKNSFYPNFKQIFPYILENKKDGDVFVTRAYRSYYWSGDKVKVLDIQTLPFEEKNCRGYVEEIINQNKSGWFILPDIDEAFVCKEGREYLSERFEEIKSESIPNTVSVYRWNN